MPDFIVTILSVSVVLGVMVLVHEWGHFIVAKAFGVRVEIFSIGFGSSPAFGDTRKCTRSAPVSDHATSVTSIRNTVRSIASCAKSALVMR